MAIAGLRGRTENKVENSFLYQAKELQTDLGLDTYDFEARMYDPVLGRTFQINPHLENYYYFSPYSWAANNPLILTDPTGMDIDLGNMYEQNDDGNYNFVSMIINEILFVRKEESTSKRQEE